MMLRGIYILVFLSHLISHRAFGQSHPLLVLSKGDVAHLKNGVTTYPLLKDTYKDVATEVDSALTQPIRVPMPKDLAGGYTHEQHKKNFLTLQKAGVIFQLTGNVKYAKWIRDVLFAYAELFPTFTRHPSTKSYSPGKFFWQCLNDANWLVYVSQAYDCIYDWLPVAERNTLNQKLFRPMADFLSAETPQFFNRIHNHSTWGNAAVGMIGLVMDDKELVERALYGLPNEAESTLLKDNDGGLINNPGPKGFLAQIDNSFSPDGYYTEGPYYQRYAMYPFLIFAEALSRNRPELKIFEYRNGVLLKSVYALVNLTNANGEFFPINDAQKGMSYIARDVVPAVDVAYHRGGQDPTLLSIAKEQGRVSLDITGFSVARGLAQQLEKPFVRKSIQLSDGADGKQGAIGILRNNESNLTVVLKYNGHGMGHGHFDKLSILMYNNEQEVFQDYGSARWVNIEQKDGGGYLKENTTWAKLTVAHNTVVINKSTQFGGDVQLADKHHPAAYLFDTSNAHYQVMSAIDSNSYAGNTMQRTLFLIGGDEAIVLDLFKITSRQTNDYDLPFYFQGDVLSTSFAYAQEKSLKPMGVNSGYQHLWKEASGLANASSLSFTWFQRGSFRTITAATLPGDSLIFGRLGANDPNFNLRRDPVFIIRRNSSTSTLFANVYEMHGRYSPVHEIASHAHSQIKEVKIMYDTDEYTVVSIQRTTGKTVYVVIALKNPDPMAEHEIKSMALRWKGATTVQEQN